MDRSVCPALVADAADAKFQDAIVHIGWVQDGSANYNFGRFGTGLDAARAAFVRAAASGRPVRILDAGCGSAGLLWHLCGIAGELGASAYLRGVTAGKEVHPSLEGVTCPLKDQSAESTATSKKNDGPCASVDVRVYHRFPLERCLTATAADFICERCKFDLILCSWTCLHLCDVLGTLVQLRSLLAEDGVLLANEVYLHVASVPGGVEPGSVAAMEALLVRLAPGLEYDLQGGPVCWVPEDETESSDWAPGEFQGGHSVSILWRATAAAAACSSAATHREQESPVARLTGDVVDKAWQLASGAQYCIASYELLPSLPCTPRG